MTRCEPAGLSFHQPDLRVSAVSIVSVSIVSDLFVVPRTIIGLTLRNGLFVLVDTLISILDQQQ
jgi:hypothetical protein